MNNYLITIANGPRDAFGRVDLQYFTVYASSIIEAEELGERIASRMDGYREVREVECL